MKLAFLILLGTLLVWGAGFSIGTMMERVDIVQSCGKTKSFIIRNLEFNCTYKGEVE